MQVALQVQDSLVARGYEFFYNSLDVDFAIYISGCTANCALKYNHSNRPFIVVAAATIETIAINKENLVNEIVLKVRNYFE